MEARGQGKVVKLADEQGKVVVEVEEVARVQGTVIENVVEEVVGVIGEGKVVEVEQVAG